LKQDFSYLRGVKILLTFDYELFFGERSGTVGKCQLEPTRDLLKLAESKNVKFTFFVDVGQLIAFERYPELGIELDQLKTQIKNMIKQDHDVQLHIHPHWEKALYENGAWTMNTEGYYKLSDFEQEEIDRIVREYKTYLDELIGRKTTVFRAGGWCIQPFYHLNGIFKELGLKYDSSVIPGDFMETSEYAIDFRDAPTKDKYRFETDVCVEIEEGSFTEFPISSLRYSPLFFWQLYVKGRLAPAKHKMIGDGVFISQGGRKKRVLTAYTTNHVSTDGYFAKKLEAGLNRSVNLGHDHLVVIGHPKGNTKYSLEKLARFIQNNHTKHIFTSFHSLLCE
jgi:peptidoglycan/xylan/chitin deacetylase (PgdA/CDA1 family)